MRKKRSQEKRAQGKGGKLLCSGEDHSRCAARPEPKVSLIGGVRTERCLGVTCGLFAGDFAGVVAEIEDRLFGLRRCFSCRAVSPASRGSVSAGVSVTCVPKVALRSPASLSILGHRNFDTNNCSRRTHAHTARKVLHPKVYSKHFDHSQGVPGLYSAAFDHAGSQVHIAKAPVSTEDCSELNGVRMEEDSRVNTWYTELFWPRSS